MIDRLFYNWKVFLLLRRLARQRVRMVVRGIWLIEYAVEDSEETEALLRTCVLRGWIDVLEDAVPTGTVNDDGSLKNGRLVEKHQTVWKLTDSGWGAIHRTHQLGVLGLMLSVLGIVLAVFL